MLPSQIGERAEAAIMAALVSAGKDVLLPLGQRRYDLAYEEEGRLVKVQCKAGLLKDGALSFRTHSVGRRSTRDYRGEVDYFGVYCLERAEAYLVPIDDVPTSRACLRLTPPRNGQSAGVRLAAQYLIRPSPGGAESYNIDDCRYYGRDELMTAMTDRLPVGCCAPLTAASIDDEQAAATADLFKALSDSHRVRIVNLLANAGEAVCVCDITEAIGLSQPTISFHLKKLVTSGLLHREKRATWAYYSLNRDALDQLADVVKVKGNRR